MKKLNTLLILAIISISALVACSSDSGNTAPNNNQNEEEPPVNKEDPQFAIHKGLYPGLPDPLVTLAGNKVTDINTWETVRRPEILSIFRDSVYGRMPQTGEYTCTSKVVSVVNVDVTRLDGTIDVGGGVRKMVEFAITGPNGTHTFQCPVYIPKSDKPVPMFLFLHHRDPYEGLKHTGSSFPLNDLILSRGYGAAVVNAFYFNEENAVRYTRGLLEKFNMNGPYDLKSLAARAFVGSRMMDYLETDPDVDVTKVAVIGHSRGAKAAIWCGVNDERIAMTIPNNGGLAGYKLANHIQGQDIEGSYNTYPRWFATRFGDFAGRDHAGTLPFDWHMLTSLIAPRLLATSSATNDGNADPVGQFHTVALTQRVFALYGKAEVKWTVDDTPSRQTTTNIEMENGNLHHQLRVGDHGLTRWDWRKYIDFADKMYGNN